MSEEQISGSHSYRRKTATHRDDRSYSTLLPSTKYWEDTPESQDESTRLDLSDSDLGLNIQSGEELAFEYRRALTLRENESNRRGKRITRHTSGRARSADYNVNDGELSQRSLNSENVSPWQQWLICKQEQAKLEKLKQKKEEEMKEREQQEKEAEKERKQALAHLKRQEWLAKKMKTELSEKLKAERLKKKEEEQKAEDERLKRAKKEERLKEWRKKKLEEENELKKKREEEQEKEKQVQMERQKKNEEKVASWMKEANARPSRVSASVGYSGGRLIGFYDWSSYPSPSFYNPVPWQETVCDFPNGKQTRGTPRTPRTNRSAKNSDKKKKAPPTPLSPPLLWREVLQRKH